MLLLCNTKQFQRVFEQSRFVVAVVLLKRFGSEAMQARRASVMLWA